MLSEICQTQVNYKNRVPICISGTLDQIVTKFTWDNLANIHPMNETKIAISSQITERLKGIHKKLGVEYSK